MCMNVIKASFYMQNWSNVLSYVSKAEQAIESLESTSKSTTTTTSAVFTLMNSPTEVSNTSTTNAAVAFDAILASRLKVYAGIAELATKRYKLVARHFLGVSFDHCSVFFQVRSVYFTLVLIYMICFSLRFEDSLCIIKKLFTDYINTSIETILCA